MQIVYCIVSSIVNVKCVYLFVFISSSIAFVLSTQQRTSPVVGSIFRSRCLFLIHPQVTPKMFASVGCGNACLPKWYSANVETDRVATINVTFSLFPQLVYVAIYGRHFADLVCLPTQRESYGTYRPSLSLGRQCMCSRSLSIVP